MAESKMGESKSVACNNAVNRSAFFTIGGKRLDVSQIRMLMYKYFHAEQYSQLKNLFNKYGIDAKQKEAFLLAGGESLVDHALNISSNPRIFAFICENFPTETIKQILSENECRIYKDFLYIQVSFNKQSESYIEKIKTLLLLDPEKTTELMKNHSDVRIRNNYKIAGERLLKTLADALPVAPAP